MAGAIYKITGSGSVVFPRLSPDAIEVTFHGTHPIDGTDRIYDEETGKINEFAAAEQLIDYALEDRDQHWEIKPTSAADQEKYGDEITYNSGEVRPTRASFKAEFDIEV